MKTRTELEQENAHIRSLLLQKDGVIESKNIALESKDAFIEQLKEALILERNRRFAKASESLRSLQGELFNEPEVEAIIADPQADDESSITVPAHKRKRSGRKPLPEDLPRVEVIHDLSDADKICPHDGYALKAIGDKVSEQLDIVPMQIQVIRHIRKQYACPCCEGFLKTAAKPKQPKHNRIYIYNVLDCAYHQ